MGTAWWGSTRSVLSTIHDIKSSARHTRILWVRLSCSVLVQWVCVGPALSNLSNTSGLGWGSTLCTDKIFRLDINSMHRPWLHNKIKVKTHWLTLHGSISARSYKPLADSLWERTSLNFRWELRSYLKPHSLSFLMQHWGVGIPFQTPNDILM